MYIVALGCLWCFIDITGGTRVGSYLFLDYFAQFVKIAKWFSTAQLMSHLIFIIWFLSEKLQDPSLWSVSVHRCHMCSWNICAPEVLQEDTKPKNTNKIIAEHQPQLSSETFFSTYSSCTCTSKCLSPEDAAAARLASSEAPGRLTPDCVSGS